jgi:hypothetical protein
MTAPRIVTSYTPDSPAHEDAVCHLGGLLDGCGMDPRLDEPPAERRLDWPLWMLQQVRDAECVLVVASPAYRRRAQEDAVTDEGRGV